MKKSSLFFFPFLSLLLLMGAGCKDSTQNQPIPAAPEQQQEAPAENQADISEEPAQEEADDAVVQENEPAVNDNPGEEEAVEPEEQNEEREEEAQSQVREFEVTAKQWEFLPGTIEVNEGDTVRLLVTSIDVDHGFAITAFGINEKLVSGETKTVEFVADKKGTFSFFCNVFCGSGHGGMKGTLVVK